MGLWEPGLLAGIDADQLPTISRPILTKSKIAQQKRSISVQFFIFILLSFLKLIVMQHGGLCSNFK